MGHLSQAILVVTCYLVLTLGHQEGHEGHQEIVHEEIATEPTVHEAMAGLNLCEYILSCPPLHWEASLFYSASNPL